MNKSEQINEIAAALAKSQAKIHGAKKDSTNPHFKSKYADLESCWEACREVLTANGIAVLQPPMECAEGVKIQTWLVHTSGQWLADDGLFIPATKMDAQGYGSALTYCRRYGLCAMVGIAPTDDDGNAAAASVKAQNEWKPTAGVWEGLDEENRTFLEGIAREVKQILAEGNEKAAAGYLANQKLLNDETVAIWTRFDSKQRASLKRGKSMLDVEAKTEAA